MLNFYSKTDFFSLRKMRACSVRLSYICKNAVIHANVNITSSFKNLFLTEKDKQIIRNNQQPCSEKKKGNPRALIEALVRQIPNNTATEILEEGC